MQTSKDSAKIAQTFNYRESSRPQEKAIQSKKRFIYVATSATKQKLTQSTRTTNNSENIPTALHIKKK